MSNQFNPLLMLSVIFNTVFLTLAGINNPLGLSVTIDLVCTPEFKIALFLILDLVCTSALSFSIDILLLSFGIDSFKNIGVSDKVHDVSKLCTKMMRKSCDSLLLTRLEFVDGLPTLSIWLV